MLSNQAPVTGNNTTASRLRPLVGWYATNADRGVGGANGTASTAATDGTQRALTEAQLKNVLQLCFTNGGNPDTIMCGPSHKVAISAFTGNATKFNDINTGNGVMVTNVDIYVSDFGRLKIIPNRFQRTREVHVLDSSMVGVDYLRDFKTEDLARTGDSVRKSIVVEYTLKMNNEAGHGIIADLTP
jgi:hypothetical protein